MNKKKANHNIYNCYWQHSQKSDCWLTTCDRAFFVTAPGWHNCPRYGGFIVIDYYGEYVKTSEGMPIVEIITKVSEYATD